MSKRYSAAEIQELLHQFARGHQKAAEFAKAKNIPLSTFYYWKRSSRLKPNVDVLPALQEMRSHLVSVLKGIITKTNKENVRSLLDQRPQSRLNAGRMRLIALLTAILKECNESLTISGILSSRFQELTEPSDSELHQMYRPNIYDSFEDEENDHEDEYTAYDSDLDFKFVQAKLEELECDLTALKEDVQEEVFSESMGDRLDDLENEISEVSTQFHDVVSGLMAQVNDLAAKVNAKPPRPTAFLRVDERIREAVSNGDPLIKKKLPLLHDPKLLMDRLQENNFVLGSEDATKILKYLETKKILILEGPPGCGKTTLAGLLPEIILGNKGTCDRIPTSPEMTADHVLGTLIEDNGHYACQLGCISEAVVKCIENKGRHWIVFDEINRGDFSSFLSPLLAATAEEEAYLHHDYLYPTHSPSSGRIPIPAMFRIIGTMNSYDKMQLFTISEALKRRVGVVKISSVPLNEKREAIVNKVMTLLKSNQNKRSTKNELSVVKDVAENVDQIVETFSRISKTKPWHVFQRGHVSFATNIALVFSAATSVLRDRTTMEYAIDDAIYHEIVPMASNWNSDLLNAVGVALLEHGYSVSANEFATLASAKEF